MRRRSAAHELGVFSYHLIGASLVFGGALVLAAATVLFLRWAIPLERASSSSHRALEASRRILELHEDFWPAAAVSLVALAVAAWWLGRRLRGPLTRYQAVFAELEAGGTPAPVAIRSTDYLALETDALNSMLAALAARERVRGEQCAALVDELDELARSAAGARLTTEIERALALAKALDPPRGSP